MLPEYKAQRYSRYECMLSINRGYTYTGFAFLSVYPIQIIVLFVKHKVASPRAIVFHLFWIQTADDPNRCRSAKVRVKKSIAQVPQTFLLDLGTIPSLLLEPPTNPK